MGEMEGNGMTGLRKAGGRCTQSLTRGLLRRVGGNRSYALPLMTCCNANENRVRTPRHGHGFRGAFSH